MVEKSVINELKEALKNLKDSDELSDLPGGSDEIASDPEKMEQLKNLLGQFKQTLGSAGGAANPGIQIHWVFYIIVIVVFVSTIGLFGYRLVQSLQEKERKREEKRKLKEGKKKK